MSKFQVVSSLSIFVFIISSSFGLTAFSSNQTTSILPASSQASVNNYLHVQLLGVNDFHGQLDKYQSVSGVKTGGAEFLAAYLKKYKQENPNTILVHAGDMVGGSPPISSQFHDEPTIEFLNQLHFDVGTPGNHELDHGVNEMKRLIYGGFNENTGYFPGSTASYISANIIDKNTGAPLFPPYVIKQIDGVKIGFIGAVTTETNLYVLPENRKEIEVTDEVSAINRTVKLLKEKGIKAIVVVAHVSAKSDQQGTNPTDALTQMAPKIDKEVDVIFAGHSHDYANTVVDGKLIVQAYSYGKAFSQVNITIDRETKDIVRKEAKIILTAHNQIQPDQETIELLKKYQKKLGSNFNTIVGAISEDISRIPDAKGESPLAKMIAESERKAMGTEIAFVHQGEMRESLKKGNVSLENLYTALPFGHHVNKVTLTGAQIKLVLEQQWRIGQENNMLQAVGITYSFDLNAPIGKRIADLKDMNGQDLQPTKEYEVAISDYLANGGDEFTAFKQGRLVEPGPLVVDVLSNYLKQNYPNVVIPH